MAEKKHYVPCQVAFDESYEARALRAGRGDGFHGYPVQPPEGKTPSEQAAYAVGFAEGRKQRV